MEGGGREREERALKVLGEVPVCTCYAIALLLWWIPFLLRLNYLLFFPKGV